MGICTKGKKYKSRKPCLQKDLREMKLVEIRGFELNSDNFITYCNFEKTPILRGLQALKILQNIKIYRKFS